MRLALFRRTFFLTIFVFSVLPGSVSGGDKEWDSVRVANDSGQIEGCEFLGEVKGKSPWGGVVENAAEAKALSNIKKNAWKMGANFVLMTTEKSGWGGSKYRGEAFLCEPEAETALVEMTVLGGILLCGPKKQAIEYLGPQTIPIGNVDGTVAAYTFEMPIPVVFGGHDPTIRQLVTKSGRVEQVIVGWKNLDDTDREHVWSELMQSFTAAKGKPGFEQGSERATWVEVGRRKETTLYHDTDNSIIKIQVSCLDPSTPEGETTVEAAF